MQISLANLLVFPPVNAQPGAAKLSPSTAPQLANDALASHSRGSGRIVPAAVPAKVAPQITPEPAAPVTAAVVSIGPRVSRDEGVTYTRAGTLNQKPSSSDLQDLDSMTLEKQLRVGRNLGVFTKITLHNDGVLVAKQEGASRRPPEFVASAVATIKDFQEGFATLIKRDALYI